MDITESFTIDGMETLPDYLRHGLDIVFVGLNPSPHSINVGHYYGNPRNRFWKALNESGIVGTKLSTETDYKAIYYGIGFTDLVKRPTPQVKDLTSKDFQQWVPRARELLLEYQPLVVAFQGVMAYKFFHRHTEGPNISPKLGIQEGKIGHSLIFITPNPSPANAQYSIHDLSHWYKELGNLRAKLRSDN